MSAPAKPKPNIFKSNLNIAKQYLMQKIGQAKKTEVPQEYTDMKESFVRTETYLGKASKQTRSYCQKSEATTKIQTDVGEYLVETGLQEKGDLSEAMIKIGEAFKTISNMHHSMLVNIVEKYVRPSMEFQDKFSNGTKLHNKFSKKLLAYDSQKSVVENTKDPQKLEQEQTLLQNCEKEKNEAYTEAEFEIHQVIHERNTKHLEQLIEFFMAYHYFFAEGYTFTSDLLPYMEKLKEKIKEEKNTKIDKKTLPNTTASVASSSSSKESDQDMLERLKKLAAEEKAAKSKNGNNEVAAVAAIATPTPKVTISSKATDTPDHESNGNISAADDVIETVTALYAYDAQDESELGFNGGDKIAVVKKDGDWWYGTANGKSGYFPSNFVKNGDVEQESSAKSTERKVLLSTTVLYDYDASDEGEISLKEGETVDVYEQLDGGWWLGKTSSSNSIGVFPGNYTEAGQNG